MQGKRGTEDEAATGKRPKLNTPHFHVDDARYCDRGKPCSRLRTHLQKVDHCIQVSNKQFMASLTDTYSVYTRPSCRACVSVSAMRGLHQLHFRARTARKHLRGSEFFLALNKESLRSSRDRPHSVESSYWERYPMFPWFLSSRCIP